MNNSNQVDELVSKLFRSEYSKIVSFLSSKFGLEFLDHAQDIAQDTLLSAFQNWTQSGIPKNPEGWIFTVAKNKSINFLNKENNKNRLKQLPFQNTDLFLIEETEYNEHINDNMLKMMFVCCSELISTESQIILTLSTLCGFSRKEIAKSLICEEEKIKKSLYRAKKKLRENNISLELPNLEMMESKIGRINNCLYLLFNEGYNSSLEDNLIRRDICLEALRLTKLLSECFQNKHSTKALFSLMCFHIARFESRVDDQGAIILFKEQNRNNWNKKLIEKGIIELGKSAEGNNLSSYHLEAGIAMEHCISESFEKTNWEKIRNFYIALQKIKQSPVIDMNLAIIEGFINGPKKAIHSLESLKSNKRLSKYHLLYASLGEFYYRNNENEKSINSFKIAIDLTQNIKEKELLKRKIVEIV